MSQAEKTKLHLLTQIANLTDPQVLAKLHEMVEELLAPAEASFSAQELESLRRGSDDLKAGRTATHKEVMVSAKEAITRGVMNRKTADGAAA